MFDFINYAIELTSEMMEKIEDALRPIPPGEVLVDAFKLQITRRDMETLAGLNWLNDEVSVVFKIFVYSLILS